MEFENTIADQSLDKTQSPSPDPTKEQPVVSLEIKGGKLELKKQPHVNYEHAIGLNFERRNNLETIKFIDGSGDIDIQPGEYAQYILRLSGPTTLSFSKPSGVPEEQHTEDGRFRHRVRTSRLKIYYAAMSQLRFDGNCIFGHIKHQYVPSVPVVVAGEPEENQTPETPNENTSGDIYIPGPGEIANVQLQNGRLLTVKDHYGADDLYRNIPPGFTDILHVEYDERTGQVFIGEIDFGIEGAEDPLGEPEEGENTEEEEEEPEEEEPTPPENPDEFKDPYGNPVVVMVPTPKNEVVIALHANSYRVSLDGGASWRDCPLVGIGVAKDIVAGPGGVYVMTEENRVYYSAGLGGTMSEVVFTTTTEDVALPIVNGDFETGDLSGWTLEEGNPPAVSDSTAEPEQYEDSTYYLTRQWRVLNSQPFTISQVITVPEELVGTDVKLFYRCEAYTENQDQVLIELFDGAESIKAKDDFPLNFSGGKFTSVGFATSPLHGELTLEGTPVSGPSYELFDDYGGVRISGTGIVSGTIHWLIKKEDGSLYPGKVAIRLFDIDSPNDNVKEVVHLSGMIYDAVKGITSAVQIAKNEDGTITLTSGVNGGLGEQAFAGRVAIIVGSEWTMQFSGSRLSGIGLTGPGGSQEDEGNTNQPIASSWGEGPAWQTITAPYFGLMPATLVAKVSGRLGAAATGYVDVFVDNVRLTVGNIEEQVAVDLMMPGQAGTNTVDVIGSKFYGKMITGSLKEELKYPAPEEDQTWTLAAGYGRPNSGTLVSNGSKTWARGVDFRDLFDGPVSDIIASPFMAAISENVMYGFPGGVPTEFFSFTNNEGQGSLHMSSDRKRVGVIVTDSSGRYCVVGYNRKEIPASETSEADFSYAISDVTDLPKKEGGGSDYRVYGMDTGRYLAFQKGQNTLFWQDDESVVGGGSEVYYWKIAGNLPAPILKLVPFKK